MKVFVNHRSGGYSGGMMIVAANSAEEAHKVFHSDERFDYMWTDWTEEESPYIDDFYYSPDAWEELPMLEAHVDTPRVLAEAGYTE